MYEKYDVDENDEKILEEKYSGDFHNNLYHGHGILIKKDGFSVKGSFYKNKINGFVFIYCYFC
jgi:hypothetical protein